MIHGVCKEFTCGCIVHPTRGRIRKCGALHSKTMGGNVVTPEPELESKHKKGRINRGRDSHTMIVGP